MSALLNSKNKLKLGIFSANCSSGQAMTKIDERWDNNLKQAQLSDEAGLEFQLPIARWIGYGGTTNFRHDELHDYYARDNAGWTAVDRVIELMFANAESFPKDVIKMLRERMVGGHGGMPLVGTPDKVVAELERLHEIGCAGATLSFVDFVGEFPYFRDEELPRLEDKGLREKLVL